MYNYVYLITNTVNYKVYVGVHSTTNLEDGYFGSGKLLKSAVNKYGIENFLREILYVYDNKADMFAKEKEIVDDFFIADLDTYNIRVGGYGGFDHIVWDAERRSKIRERMKGNSYNKGVKWTEEQRELQRSSPGHRSEQKRALISAVHKGKPKSEDQKKKMSDSRRNQVRKTCPHCGISGCSGQMTRYHFDKCKQKRVL